MAQPVVLALLGVVTLLVLAACSTQDDAPAARPDAPLQKDETGRFPAPPHDETGHTWHHDDDLLIEIVRDGGMGDENFYEMPAFGAALDDAEIKAVLAFIKTMWTDEQRAAQQARTEAARES